MNRTLLTASELANRIHFSSTYINHALKDTIFLQGQHYIRPFGGRKIFYIWEAIEKELFKPSSPTQFIIPMARGGVCHG